MFSKKVRRSCCWCTHTYTYTHIHTHTLTHKHAYTHLYTTGLHRIPGGGWVGRVWREAVYGQPVFVIRGLDGASRAARRQQQVKRDSSWPRSRPSARRGCGDCDGDCHLLHRCCHSHTPPPPPPSGQRYPSATP